MRRRIWGPTRAPWESWTRTWEPWIPLCSQNRAPLAEFIWGQGQKGTSVYPWPAPLVSFSCAKSVCDGGSNGTRECIQGRRGIWENTQPPGHRVCGGRAGWWEEHRPALRPSRLWVGTLQTFRSPRAQHRACSKWVIPLLRVWEVTLRELREFSGASLGKGREECFSLHMWKQEEFTAKSGEKSRPWTKF